MENSYAPDSYIDSVSNRYFIYSYTFMYVTCVHEFTIS